MQTHPSKLSLFCATTLLAVAGSLGGLHATVLVSSDFDTGYTADAVLSGQSGGGDVGLSGTYSASTASLGVNVRNADFVGINTTYNVSGGGTISGGSHYVLLDNFTAVPAIGYTRNLASGIGGQTLYSRVVLVPKDGFNTDTFILFGLDHSGPDNASAIVGISPDGSNAVASSALNGTFAPFAGGTLANDAAYLLVARFNWDGSGYTSVDTWLNPTATDFNTPDATQAITGYAPTFNSISLKVANVSNGKYFGMDSLAVGTAWSDVVAIPEPSTWAMLAFSAGAGLLLRRRRA